MKGSQPLGPYVDVVAGTRPEIIKLAPVIHELRSRGASPRLLLTGQHRELVNNLLETLELQDIETIRFDIMQPRQGLSGLASRILEVLGSHFSQLPAPVIVIVQGDTTSAMCASLAAFHEKIPVAHVEAGLRSGQIDNPFPEELNRELITKIARWHFCPTQHAADNLIRERVNVAHIAITGNTSIDTLQWIQERGLGVSAFQPCCHRNCRVLVTLHRRENQGMPMREIATALVDLAERLDLDVVLPIHPNPEVRDVLVPILSHSAFIRITDALNYADFVATMADADVVVTDSGGVQEEAPAVSTATLVVRETTERPEAVVSGCARLIGVTSIALRNNLEELVMNPDIRIAMTQNGSPFGDGHAAERIVERLISDQGFRIN